jgi:hypothetical protein
MEDKYCFSMEKGCEEYELDLTSYHDKTVVDPFLN